MNWYNFNLKFLCSEDVYKFSQMFFFKEKILKWMPQLVCVWKQAFILISKNNWLMTHSIT